MWKRASEMFAPELESCRIQDSHRVSQKPLRTKHVLLKLQRSKWRAVSHMASSSAADRNRTSAHAGQMARGFGMRIALLDLKEALAQQPQSLFALLRPGGRAVCRVLGCWAPGRKIPRLLKCSRRNSSVKAMLETSRSELKGTSSSNSNTFGSSHSRSNATTNVVTRTLLLDYTTEDQDLMPVDSHSIGRRTRRVPCLLL